MTTFRLWVRRAYMTLIGLVPIGCHYNVTAPRLWQHNSSAAFDIWLGLYVFGVIFLAMCVVAAAQEGRR